VATAFIVALAALFVRCGRASTEVASAPPSADATASPPPSVAPEPDAVPAEAGAESPAAAPKARHRYRVAAIGDSLTDEKSHGGGYLSYLGKRCPESRFDNYGVGGNMVNQMRRRFERDVPVAKSAYTHLIVFGGVNDLYSDLTAGRTPEKIEKDLTAMYAAAKSRGWKVVAITVSPWGGFEKYFNESRSAATHTLNDWLKGRVGKQVDYVVDAFALLSCGEPDVLCPEYAKPFKDGLHFGPAGHEKLGEKLFEEVFADCR
jgi:lysophospholipase L1-like esterase